MTNTLPVYDIEGELEQAIERIMNQKMVTITNQDPEQFQRANPRLEVQVGLGAGKERQIAPAELTLLPMDVEDVFECTIYCQIITGSNVDDNDPIKSHRFYRAWTRYYMNILPSLINNQPGGIMNHWVGFPMYHKGSTPMWKPEDGRLRTDMTWGTFVGIHVQAWTNLQ